MGSTVTLTHLIYFSTNSTTVTLRNTLSVLSLLFLLPLPHNSDIAQHATELAKSVIQLTESAKENPSTEEFDVAMQDLVKKYIDFEQIIAKT